MFTAVAAINFVGRRETQAAVLITALDAPITENFDTYAGTAATIPANFTWDTAASSVTFGGTFDGNTAYSSAVNNMSLAQYFSPTSTTDRAFGAKRRSEGGGPTNPPANPDSGGTNLYVLTWSFVNNTGADISQFNISWNVEQYGQGNRSTALDFNYNPNGAGVTASGISGQTFTSALRGNGGTDPATQVNFYSSNTVDSYELDPNQTTTSTNRGVKTSPVITAYSVTVTPTTPLADGQSIDFRWTNRSGNGNAINALIGWDHLSVTAVPEPATVGLSGLVCTAGLVRRARRRR